MKMLARQETAPRLGGRSTQPIECEQSLFAEPLGEPGSRQAQQRTERPHAERVESRQRLGRPGQTLHRQRRKLAHESIACAHHDV
ncbi:MAG: hypothetical protein ACK55I_48485, partial [bacterium]